MGHITLTPEQGAGTWHQPYHAEGGVLRRRLPGVLCPPSRSRPGCSAPTYGPWALSHPVCPPKRPSSALLSSLLSPVISAVPTSATSPCTSNYVCSTRLSPVLPNSSPRCNDVGQTLPGVSESPQSTGLSSPPRLPLGCPGAGDAAQTPFLPPVDLTPKWTPALILRPYPLRLPQTGHGQALGERLSSLTFPPSAH